LEHIHNIEIKNFKSIRHASIEGCKRINVFIGAPNVGKSNILEALGSYSIAQQVNLERFPFNSICRYNHYSDLFFDKNLQNKIAIEINGSHILSFSRKENLSAEFEIFIHTLGSFRSAGFSTVVGEESNFKLYTLPAEDIPNNEIFKIKYYHFEKNKPVNTPKSLSLSIPNGDNLLDILNGNSNLRKQYSDLLSSYRLRLNISENEIAVAKELNDGTFVSFPVNLIADTLQRLFFYMAAIQTNINSVLLFEEPEAHMFPPYITKFTTDIIFDENNNQYFIATHSPFVLTDFIEELKPKDLSIYLVDYKNGETVIKRLRDEQVLEVAQYGVDLFFNLESYLDD
jgi:AAA15 family ATPase/GTPase